MELWEATRDSRDNWDDHPAEQNDMFSVSVFYPFRVKSETYINHGNTRPAVDERLQRREYCRSLHCNFDRVC